MRNIATSLLAAMISTLVQGQVPDYCPRLVVMITVDQLRSDYLYAFNDLYGEGGFKRLFESGCIYTNAQYSSGNIDESSAVASLYTGTVPYNHGVISDSWLERASLRPVYCISDEHCSGIPSGKGYSPKRLYSSTIGDELKLSTNGKGKVISIAPDNQVAVLSAGHAGDWSMWIDDASGVWTSTNYYEKHPAWSKHLDVNSINRSISTVKWSPSSYSSGHFNYYLSETEDKNFSHKFAGSNRYKLYKRSGLVNSAVTDMADAVLRTSGVGNDDVPDLLNVTYYAGFYDETECSSPTLELQDTYVRLDQSLSRLIDLIDKRVGLSRTLIVLTSLGYDRISDENLSNYKIPTSDFRMDRCTSLLNMYLTAIYGQGQYVDSHYDQYIYLNHKLLEERQINVQELIGRCEDFLFQYSGVRDVYTSRRLSQGALDGFGSRIRNSFNPHRSGDIYVDIMPGWTFQSQKDGKKRIVRDSFYEIPVIFFGHNIKSQKISTPINVERIAPTVAHSMRIRAPNSCSLQSLSCFSE